MAAGPSPHWTPARLVERRSESATARTLLLEVADWPGHLPGQHVDVRLTGDDGYQAVRSYSLAAPADGGRLELGIQPIPSGEVSPYLADELPVNARVEVKGPLGGWFVWHAEQRGPVLLVAGGSGIVPLMAMLRAHRAMGSTAPFRLLYSVRTPQDVWYRAELRAWTEPGHPYMDRPLGGERHEAHPHTPQHARLSEPSESAQPAVRILYTREAPPGSDRPPGHLGASDLPPTDPATLCFVCGPTAFVEHSGDLLVRAGRDPHRVRTERFG